MTEPVVYTTFDKAKRDELWRELRARGRGAERQAVRFSGVEQFGVTKPTRIVRRWVVDGTVTRVAHRRVRLDDGKYYLVPFERIRPRRVYALKSLDVSVERPVFRSTWSVSHPAEIETKTGEN